MHISELFICHARHGYTTLCTVTCNAIITDNIGSTHIERVKVVLQSGGYKNFLACADSGNHRWYLDSWMYLAVISLPMQTEAHQWHITHVHVHTYTHDIRTHVRTCAHTHTVNTIHKDSSVCLASLCCIGFLLTFEPSSVEHFVGLHSRPH